MKTIIMVTCMNEQRPSRPTREEERQTTPTGEQASTGNKGAGVPRTSLEAFHSLDPADVQSIQRTIVREVLARGGDTCVHLAHRCDLPEDSTWKRCSELLAAGVLRRDGRKVNPSGREASFLVATEHAKAWLEGIYDLDANRVRSKAERTARAVKAADAVVAAGKPIAGGLVGVPMNLMVDLSVALTRAKEP